MNRLLSGAAATFVPVGVEQVGARLRMRSGPVDGAFGLVDAERLVELPFREILAGAAVVDGGLAVDLGQGRGAIAVFQDAEHAAALDAR